MLVLIKEQERGLLTNVGPRNAYGKAQEYGTLETSRRSIRAEAGMQNQDTERKTLARQISN